MKTIYVIEITAGEYDQKWTYVYDIAYANAADAHQKAHEIEGNDPDVFCIIKAVQIK